MYKQRQKCSAAVFFYVNVFEKVYVGLYFLESYVTVKIAVFGLVGLL